MDRRRFTFVAAVAGALAPSTTFADDLTRFAARAMALREEAIRRGDQPYGAVVVKDGVIVGEGVSAVITRNDADAHAERVALRDAQRRSNSADLAGCVLFGSSRACTLCEAAAYRAGIARMYFGVGATDAGAPRSML
jgi:tRNA(adenine34) deaminase